MNDVVVTVDIEGDFGTAALRGIDECLPRLLDLFDEFDVSATGFVVADVARQRPDAVRRWQARGHEVASHSRSHRPLSRLSAAARQAELSESAQLLADLVGQPCTGFRAPFFDAPRDLGPQLAAAGYRWSSSLAPFSPVALYRGLGASRRPHVWPGGVRELPVPGVLGLPIPDGLSWRRLFWPLGQLQRTGPRVFYLHPYDLLPGGDFGYPAWQKPLMTWRSGAWSWRHLRQLLGQWRQHGARFVPGSEVAGQA